MARRFHVLPTPGPFPRRPSAHARHARTPRTRTRASQSQSRSAPRAQRSRRARALPPAATRGRVSSGRNAVELASPGARIPRQRGPVGGRSPRPASLQLQVPQTPGVPPGPAGFLPITGTAAPPSRAGPPRPSPTLWGSPAAPSPRGPAGLGWFPPEGWRPGRTRGEEAGMHMRRGRAPAGAARGSALTAGAAGAARPSERCLAANP